MLQLSRAEKKPDGESWLYSEEQQLLIQFRSDAATLHARWVQMRTFTWIQLRPLVPQTARRMLRHNALEAWAHMQKTGWLRCRPPVRRSGVTGLAARCRLGYSYFMEGPQHRVLSSFPGVS